MTPGANSPEHVIPSLRHLSWLLLPAGVAGTRASWLTALIRRARDGRV